MSELLAHNFAGKISAPSKALQVLQSFLPVGRQQRKNSATTMQSVDQSLLRCSEEKLVRDYFRTGTGMTDVIEDYRKWEKKSKK